MIRTLFFLAVLCLAFAPAPLPRRRNLEDSLEVKNLVGTWRIAEMSHLPKQVGVDPVKQRVTHIVIDPTRWTFHGPAAVTYDLRIHHAKTPAEFDLVKTGEPTPYGRGIIRREGRAIRVIYRWDGGRPTDFKGQATGCEMLLVRQ